MASIHALEPHTVLDTFSHRLSSAVRSAWEGYWIRKAERATVLALRSLDDRTLKDIGMDRSEIESVVYTPTGDRAHASERRVTACA